MYQVRNYQRPFYGPEAYLSPALKQFYAMLPPGQQYGLLQPDQPQQRNYAMPADTSTGAGGNPLTLIRQLWPQEADGYASTAQLGDAGGVTNWADHSGIGRVLGLNSGGRNNGY